MRIAGLCLAIMVLQAASVFAQQAGLSTPGVNVYPNDNFAIARADAGIFLANENNVYAVAYNPATNQALFATNTSNPSTIVQVDMGSLTTPPTRVGAVQLNAQEVNCVTAVLDSVNNVALFTTDNTSSAPAHVIKVAFGTGGNPPTRVGGLTLNAGESRAYAAVIDPASGQMLVGTITSPGIVVKVAVNGPTQAPTRVGAVTMNSGENGFASAVLDTTTGTALFPLFSTAPSSVIKIAMNDIASPPTRVSAVTLNVGEDQVVSAVIDTATQTALFGTFDSPAKIVKVAYDATANPPVRIGAATLNAGENVDYALALDAASGVAAAATNLTQGGARLQVNDAATAPVRTAGLNFGISGFVASYFDQANSRFIFVPVTGTNTQIFSVVYSPAGALTGTRITVPEAAVVSEVRMYTHVAGSTVRMGIYDTSNNLLWQSNTPVATVAGGEIFAQISSGTPSTLTLPAGDYFVTFQSSSTAAVPSFTAGATGDGFTSYQSFGASPATLTSPISTSARYTQYLVYVIGTDKNVGDGGPPVTNPLNGIKISVANSSGGLITLAIDVTAVNRGVATALTDFDDIPGRQTKAVPGLRPSHTFVQPGVFVATAKGIDSITGEPRGFMRKQLALGSRETGQSGALGFAASKDISVKSLKGKFLFTKDTPDQVSFSGTIVMPAGLDLARADGQTLSLGIGNITDSIVVSSKGKGLTPSSSGRIKTLKVKFPRLAKGTTLTAGGEKADVQFTINTANLDTSGFDTEGITAGLAAGEDKKKGADRNIQVALVLAGVPYESLAPVLFKLSSKQDAGTIAGRSSKR